MTVSGHPPEDGDPGLHSGELLGKRNIFPVASIRFGFMVNREGETTDYKDVKSGPA